jgi:hypothetical protein
MKFKLAKKSIKIKVNRRKYPDLEEEVFNRAKVEVFNRAKVKAVSNITMNSNFTQLLTSNELRNMTLPSRIVW